VARVAAEQGLTPKEYADLMADVWRELPQRINASNDFFIRTTDDGHKEFVQEFLQRIYDRGDIYEDTYAGLYCVGCESFKSDSELVDGLCPDHGIEPEWIEERNWFFRLSSYREPLLRLYDDNPSFVLPAFRANEARSFIESGLQDFSISRAGQTWGVPIPWDPGQVAYVWADALVNYLSALTYARADDLRTRFWPGVRHLLAKDILRFHCVYWPAMLLSAGYDPPSQLFVHGFLLLDDRKISKSRGNVIDPLDLIDVYGADPVRFWCARAVSFGQDGNASIEGLHERYERELGNDLGNLLSRTTAMVSRYREGSLAAHPRSDSAVAALVDDLADDVATRLDRFEITDALERIWEVVRGLNRHVESAAPWNLAKDPARADELDWVLYDLVDGLRIVAIALAAYLPETAERVLAALNQPAGIDWPLVAYGMTGPTSGIVPAAPLFPRIDEPVRA
jgi:methionyl-tRNA synthetase